MNRTIQCPSCQVELTIPESAEGRKLRCPKCATKFAATTPANSASLRVPHAAPMEAPKRVKVPPSSGSFPTRGHSDLTLPVSTGDLRDTLDIPLLMDDEAPPQQPRPTASPVDVSALFDDDDAPIRPSRRLIAESKRQARRCPSCTSVVPAGMSLCQRCGLDLDTGQRIDLEPEPDEEVEEAVRYRKQQGPPANILVVGISATMAAAALTLISFFGITGLGGNALGRVSLFGVVAGLQFLAGSTMRSLNVALLLGAAVNLVALIILPAVLAETVDPFAVAVPEVEAGRDTEKPPTAEPADDVLGTAPLAQRVDMTKITWGIVILLIDALVLVYINTPRVKKYFEHRSRRLDETGAIGI